MFKKAFIVVAMLLLLCSSVFAVRLIDPISKELSSTENNFTGTVAVGNTIELIFSKELTDKYESIELVTELPGGFTYSTRNELESLKLFISVPADAVIGNYSISVNLSGSKRSDKVSLYFTVVKGMLKVSPSDVVEQVVNVDSPAEYKIFFVNPTDADAVFTISPTLSGNWLSINAFAQNISTDDLHNIVVVVPKGQKVEKAFFVYPRIEGLKEFKTIVSFEDTKKEFSFAVNGKSTFKSKMEAVFYGLPFYSFSLMPSYYASGLLSFLFN